MRGFKGRKKKKTGGASWRQSGRKNPWIAQVVSQNSPPHSSSSCFLLKKRKNAIVCVCVLKDSIRFVPFYYSRTTSGRALRLPFDCLLKRKKKKGGENLHMYKYASLVQQYSSTTTPMIISQKAVVSSLCNNVNQRPSILFVFCFFGGF